MNGCRIRILNKWKFFFPKIHISFQNEWKMQPWKEVVDMDGNNYGRFTHLWRFIIDDGNHLQKLDKGAPHLGYWKSIHLWLLELGMHVYIG